MVQPLIALVAVFYGVPIAVLCLLTLFFATLWRLLTKHLGSVRSMLFCGLIVPVVMFGVGRLWPRADAEYIHPGVLLMQVSALALPGSLLISRSILRKGRQAD